MFSHIPCNIRLFAFKTSEKFFEQKSLYQTIKTLASNLCPVSSIGSSTVSPVWSWQVIRKHPWTKCQKSSSGVAEDSHRSRYISCEIWLRGRL